MEKRKDYTFNIIVIGSGGTGTYFLKEFSRYLSGNRKVLKMIQSLTIIDGDVVEKKILEGRHLHRKISEITRLL